MCSNCGTPNNNCDCNCNPDKYSSEITFDGLSFSCPELNAIVPNCNNLNDVLNLFATKLCELILAKNLFSVFKVIIGPWDMQGTPTLSFPHGLSATEFNTVVGIDIIIKNDLQDLFIPLGVGSGTSSNGFCSIDATNINITRIAGETFDSPAYSSLALNRAVALIKYTKDL